MQEHVICTEGCIELVYGEGRAYYTKLPVPTLERPPCGLSGGKPYIFESHFCNV